MLTYTTVILSPSINLSIVRSTLYKIVLRRYENTAST